MQARELSRAWILSGAMVVAGMVTYVFHVLAIRSLALASYAQSYPLVLNGSSVMGFAEGIARKACATTRTRSEPCT
jgi:hypothetical protein